MIGPLRGRFRRRVEVDPVAQLEDLVVLRAAFGAAGNGVHLQRFLELAAVGLDDAFRGRVVGVAGHQNLAQAHLLRRGKAQRQDLASEALLPARRSDAVADVTAIGDEVVGAELGPDRGLADVIAEHTGDREIGLLKIDVEGYEPEVLAGAPGLFADGLVRTAILEVTPDVDASWAADLIASAVDYEAFVVGEVGGLVRRTDLRPVVASEVAARPDQWNLLLRRRL